MTDVTHVAPPRQDARDLQLRLYREIGVSAVAAALLFSGRPEPKTLTGMDKAAQKPQAVAARAA